MNLKFKKMKQKDNYSENDLIKSVNGILFGSETGRLPAPPMLMVSRINIINQEMGKYKKGEIIAELDIDAKIGFSNATLNKTPSCLGV